MRAIHLSLITICLLIIRIIEVIFNLYFMFYIHDIILIVLVLSTLVYGILYRRQYLYELFKRIDRMSIKIVNLVLLILLWFIMFIFSIQGIFRISDYLLTTQMSQLGWGLRDLLYGKLVNVMQYLIQLIPLLVYMTFFNLKKQES